MMPNQFFTPQSFYSLAGSAGIVYIVSNALQSAFNVNPRWFALVLSEAVALYGTYAAQSAQVPSDYFIALLNGCLIYCTAVGGNTLAVAAAIDHGEDIEGGKVGVRHVGLLCCEAATTGPRYARVSGRVRRHANKRIFRRAPLALGGCSEAEDPRGDKIVLLQARSKKRCALPSYRPASCAYQGYDCLCGFHC